MSSNPATVERTAPASPAAPSLTVRPRRQRLGSTLTATSEPMIWLTGGALAISLAMIIGLLLLVLGRGLSTFWPSPVVELRLANDQKTFGEITRHERYRPSAQLLAELPAENAAIIRAAAEGGDGTVRRQLVRTGNYDLTAHHFEWIDDPLIAETSHPSAVAVVERLSWGRFYGIPQALSVDGQDVATTPAEVWQRYDDLHPAVRERYAERVRHAKHGLGAVNRRKNVARLAVVSARLAHGKDSSEYRAAEAKQAELSEWEKSESKRITEEIAALDAENARYQMRFVTADGQEKVLPLEQIVRAYAPNDLGLVGKLGVVLVALGRIPSGGAARSQ